MGNENRTIMIKTQNTEIRLCRLFIILFIMIIVNRSRELLIAPAYLTVYRAFDFGIYKYVFSGKFRVMIIKKILSNNR